MSFCLSFRTAWAVGFDATFSPTYVAMRCLNGGSCVSIDAIENFEPVRRKKPKEKGDGGAEKPQFDAVAVTIETNQRSAEIEVKHTGAKRAS